jgi:tRNA(Ile)-lysidine synthase TilS/MesJ
MLKFWMQAAFVSDLSSFYRVPFHYRIWDETECKGAMHERARAWRQRECMALLNSSLGGGVVCTAHHLDDQLETTLMKLIRGVHLANIRGVSVQLRL